MKKRVFSMLLALVMALSLLPTMAVAEELWGQDNYFELQYNDCNYDGSSHASITVDTVDSEPISADFYPFAQEAMQFVLTPDPTMPDADPFVEIEVYDGNESTPNTLYESRCNDDHKLNLVQNNSNYSFSFTPTSNKFFSVRVYWSDRDRYETFGFNEKEEIQLRYRVLGNADVKFNGNDRGRVNYHDDRDGYQYCKQNLTITTEAITVTLAAGDGFRLEKVELGDNTVTVDGNNQFLWYNADFSKELKVEFKNPNAGSGGDGGNPGGNGGPQGDPQGGTRWDVLRSEIENYIFAYGPAGSTQSETEMLKKGIAAELYARKMGNGPGSSDTTLGMALGYNPEGGDDMSTAEAAIKAGITINNDKTSGGIAGCSYYTFSVKISKKKDNTPIDVNPDQAGDQPFTATGKVYVLPKDNDFILKTKKTTEGVSTTEYKIVSCAGYKDDKQLGDSGCEELDRFVYAPFDVNDRGEPAIEAYGNGIFLNNAISEDGSVFGFHAACEHCGSIGNINCRLIVSSAEYSIQISSTDDAAAWNFINVGVYAAEGTKEEPVNATIFFGSRTISFRTATGSKQVTNVEAVGLPSGAVSFNPETKVLTFHTNYDEIKVKVTYGTGESATEGYMLLHRVGLSISKTNNTNNGFVTGHGSDHFVRYPSAGEGKDKVVYATFYYEDNSVVNGEGKATAVKNHYDSISDKVSLFVTITKNDGTVTTQVISTPITYAARAYVAENGGMEADCNPDNVIGYAGQGSNHFYDDFVLWSGSNSDFTAIKSISAIVYTPGANDDTFGGVKVGSGTGVQWFNSAK